MEVFKMNGDESRDIKKIWGVFCDVRAFIRERDKLPSPADMYQICESNGVGFGDVISLLVAFDEWRMKYKEDIIKYIARI